MDATASEMVTEAVDASCFHGGVPISFEWQWWAYSQMATAGLALRQLLYARGGCVYWASLYEFCFSGSKMPDITLDYCKRGYFRWRKIAQMLARLFTWGLFSRYYPKFLHKGVWVLFSRGGNFREEDKSAKNAKITPREIFYVNSINECQTVWGKTSHALKVKISSSRYININCLILLKLKGYIKILPCNLNYRDP